MRNKNIHEELLHAALLDHADEVKLHLENGADVNFVDSDARTPMTWAIFHSSKKLLEVLLDNGVDIYGFTDGAPLLNKLARRADIGFEDLGRGLIDIVIEYDVKEQFKVMEGPDGCTPYNELTKQEMKDYYDTEMSKKRVLEAYRKHQLEEKQESERLEQEATSKDKGFASAFKYACGFFVSNVPNGSSVELSPIQPPKIKAE